jgi:hypothetical protein
MDAIQFLKQEHEKAKAAFGKALQAPPDTRGALWAEVWGETRLKRAGTEMEEMKSKTKRQVA